MTKLAMLASAGIILAPSAVAAEDTIIDTYENATSLEAACQHLSGFAIGYVVAVYDTRVIMTKGWNLPPQVCPSQHVTMKQLVEVACDYIHIHPDKRHYTGADIVSEALREAYPCGQ